MASDRTHGSQFDHLLSVLKRVGAPSGVEEWLIAEPATDPLPAKAQPSADYAQGIFDLLTALGALTESGEASSPTAYYFLRSLSAAIKDHSLPADGWQGAPHDPCAGMGARLLRAVEEHRLHCTENPSPLRVVSAVASIIKVQRDGEDMYLMQYDEKARQFQPLGGKQELYDADGSAALTRELCEELNLAGLVPGVDFQFVPLAQHVQASEVSASLHIVTRYDHSFFHLTHVRFPLHTDHITRWISAAELATRRTHDGLAISMIYEDLIPGVLPTLGYSL